MDLRQVLPAGIELDGKYRIERVIGAGGFGITYAAHDVGLNTTIALKEYYPAEFGTRDRTMTVRPKTENDRDLFERLRQSFVREARTLAKFKHPSIVRVLSVFESHGTAYMVMEYEDGRSLKAWLKEAGRRPTQDELDRMFAPLLDALEALHDAEFLHRDIAPDNIIIRADGSPVLLDFGAARRVAAEHSTTMTGLVKQGYSPQEQYTTDGRAQGPWTDIYALGATLYHAVTGAPPLESTVRMIEDTLVPAAKAGEGYRRSFLAGIDRAMAVLPKERPQTVAELRAMLFEGVTLAALRTKTTGTTATGTTATTGLVNVTAVLARQVTALKSAATDANQPMLRFGVIAGALVIALFGAYQLGGRSPVLVAPAQTDKTGVKTDKVGGPLRAGGAGRADPLQDALRPLQETIERTRPDVGDDARRELELREQQRRADEQREAERRDQERRTSVRRDDDRTKAADDAYRDGVKAANGTGVVQDYGKARGLFETAAAAGRADAMNWLGWLYFHGRGTAQDYPKSREWYEKSAAGGNTGALSQLGWIHQHGLGLPKDFNKAREWYEKALAAGDLASANQLGLFYQNGNGVQQDYARARQFFDRAAAGGITAAMNNLGLLYQNGNGAAADQVRAREWFEKSAAGGNSAGMNNLGWYYQNGLGGAQDLAKAREWYEKAAAGGNAWGYNNLALLYQNGRGVGQDHNRARELFEKSANLGNGNAMHSLALMLQHGRGVVQDYVKAREWYEKGAATGNASSVNQLGWLYQYGLGVTKDLAKARQFYERGAEGGASASMNQLGVFYQDGLGVQKDPVKARQWYEKSIAAGASGTALWNLANVLSGGQGGAADHPRAAKLLLDAARQGHEQSVKDLAGPMAKWNRLTRTELKRELRRLGHYNGTVNETWDDAAKKGVEAYRGEQKG